MFITLQAYSYSMFGTNEIHRVSGRGNNLDTKQFFYAFKPLLLQECFFNITRLGSTIIEGKFMGIILAFVLCSCFLIVLLRNLLSKMCYIIVCSNIVS